MFHAAGEYWKFEEKVKKQFLSFVFLREGWEPQVIIVCNVSVSSDSDDSNLCEVMVQSET